MSWLKVTAVTECHLQFVQVSRYFSGNLVTYNFVHSGCQIFFWIPVQNVGSVVITVTQLESLTLLFMSARKSDTVYKIYNAAVSFSNGI